MKRQRASRDINTVKHGKFLATLAAATSLSSNERVEQRNASDDAPAYPPIISTPIHSTPAPPPSMNFGNSTPVDGEIQIVESSNHLFDIDVSLFEDQPDFGDDDDGPTDRSWTDEETPAPLYSNCAISLEKFCCILVAYQRKNRISDVAMDGFCKLIKRLLPTPNICPESFGVVQRVIRRLINRQFGGMCSDVLWLCTNCQTQFPSRKNCLSCCETVGRPRKPAAFFQCNVEKQLKLVVEVYGQDIIKFLSDSAIFCQESTAVRDLTSGYYYREHVMPNPRGDHLTLHLLINADGAKFTKAKTGSFWPIDAQIIELPPKLRVKFENSILFALWQGESKPDWQVVMSRIVNELRTLSRVGFTAKINGRLYFVRIRILATVFDLPAAASIWNTVQFNGKYGCMHCKEPGVVFNKRRIWPFKGLSSIELKDTKFWLEAYQAIASGSPVPYFGVKGRSVFADLSVDPHQQNALDFMHQAYEGVFDKILSILFGSGKPWCLGKGKNLRDIDGLMSTIKFPVDFQRRIPSLENLSYFKASEFKNLLLYGIVPALSTFLLAHNIAEPMVIDFIHWIIVYHEVAVRLNSDEVDLQSLDFVSRLVSVWQQLLPDFLGEENQTYNAHSTCHIVHFVRSLGPLHNYSTFAFESFNNVYARMVTSAHGTLSQVARRFVEEKFIKLWQKSSSKSDDAAALVNDILQKPDNSGKCYGCVKILSNVETVSLSAAEADAMELGFGESVSRILSVTAVKVGSILVRTESFEQGKTMCTHIAKFCEQEGTFYGTVHKMFIHMDRVFALCKELRVIGRLIDKIAPCNDDRFAVLWDSDSRSALCGSFFKLVDYSDVFRIIEMQNLTKRCILADLKPYVILMEECMSFEHN